MQAPANQAQPSARVRLRIQSIEVGFESPPQYAINIKLLSHERLLFNLEAIKSGQPLRWEDIHPIDLDQSEFIEVRVYELHWIGMKRERVGAVSFKVREMVNGESSVTARDDSANSPFSVALTLVPTDDGRGAAQNAQSAANVSVVMSPSLLESMGRARDAVEMILKIGEQLADLNPIIKVSVALCTQAWETLKEQDRCDALIAKLVTEMGDVLPHVAAVKDYANLSNLQGTLKELLLLVEDASRFVVEYKSDGAAVRAIRAFLSSSAQDQVDEFIDRFRKLKENFDRGMTTQVVQGVDTLLGDADRALLKPLIVPGAGYDLGRCCLEGTRMEVLDDIRNWALTVAGSTRLYWLYGPAGCGKSAVSTSVSESLHNAGVLGGSFFCKRDSENLRKPENVISDIAASLAHKYPEYGAKLVEALRADPKLADSPMKTRFAGLIVTPFQSVGRCEHFRTSTVVVDAIDECGTADSRAELVRCLLQLSQLASWLKVLVTSRPNEEIQNILGIAKEGIERRDLFAEDQASVSRDILAYIRSRMNAIPVDTTWRERWPGEEEIRQLSTRANRLFIWARTACNLIQQSLDPEATLKHILAGKQSKGAEKALGDIYNTALNEGLGEANDDASIIQLCVGAIVLTGSRRPLPDAALAGILAGRIKPHAVSRLINRLGSVLYRDDHSAVRMLHQSFGDYMTGNDCPEEYRTDVAVQNAELAASCLQVMLRGLRLNICGLESSCVMNRDVPDLLSRIEQNISLELSYSCLYWTTHLTTTHFATISPGIPKLLDEFLLGVHLLYWIEVLSLTKELHTITERMEQLMGWINDPQNKYSKIVDDIYRFLWAAVEPISSSTPHLYVSALAFGAANFESLRAIKPQFPNMLSVNGGENLWKSPCLRKIQAEARIICISLSSDGRRIVSGCNDKTVRIWDAHTGASLLGPLQGHSGDVTCVAISSDGRRIFSGSDDETLRVWDAHTGAILLEPLQAYSKVTCVAVSSDGRRIVSGCWDKTLRIWDAHTGAALLESLRGHSSGVTCVAISSDGGRIISGSHDDTLRIWDVHTGTLLLGPLRGHSGSVTSVAVSPDGQRIISGSHDKSVRIWDAHTGTLLVEPLQGHSLSVTSVAVSSHAQRIVSGCSGQIVRIWDAHTGAPLLEPLVHGASWGAMRVAISSDGQRVLSSSGKTLQIWDAHPGASLLKPPQGHSDRVICVAISSDGRRIVSGSQDKTLRIWDTQTGDTLLEPLQGHSGQVRCVAISSDGHRIVSGSNDKTVRVWDAYTGASLLEPLQGHSGEVTCVSISSDGRRIFSGSNDETLRVWDAHTGAILLEPLQAYSKVTCIAVSSDGGRIVSGSWDTTLQIWDAHNGAPLLGPLQGHSWAVTCVAFSPDCQRIVSGSLDSTVQIWDAHTGAALLEPLHGHLSPVTCVAISSDGQHIVSGSLDTTVRTWHLHTGASLLRPLQGHLGGLTSVAITSDGSRVVSCSDDKTLRIWDSQTGAALLEPLQGDIEWVTHFAIPSDHRLIVNGKSENGAVRIWDAHIGAALLEPLQGHSARVTSIAISSDGQRIVSGFDDMTVRIWDAQTGDALLEPLRGHSDEVTCVAISSDGQRIVSGSRDRDRTVRIWDAHTGAELFKMRHGDWHTVTCVAVSSDGQRIVSGSDKTLHIWDALTGAPLLDPPHRFSNPVTCVSISHGDRYIISASSDNTVRILDMQSGSVFFEPFLLLSSTATSVSISSDTQQIVFGSNSSIVWVQNFPDGLRPLTFQDIFQNSSSSDISRYSRVMSVQLSMLCDQQGWVRGSSGELLLWIPPEYQRTRPDHSILAISTNPENHPVHFDLSRIKIGNDWANLVS